MHGEWSPLYTPVVAGLFGFALPFIVLTILITIVLKGYALWYAARAGQKHWFIALLVINTLGILEIIYLLFFRPDAPYADSLKNEKPVHEHSHHTHSSSDSSSAA